MVKAAAFERDIGATHNSVEMAGVKAGGRLKVHRKTQAEGHAIVPYRPGKVTAQERGSGVFAVRLGGPAANEAEVCRGNIDETQAGPYLARRGGFVRP